MQLLLTALPILSNYTGFSVYIITLISYSFKQNFQEKRTSVSFMQGKHSLDKQLQYGKQKQYESKEYVDLKSYRFIPIYEGTAIFALQPVFKLCQMCSYQKQYP